MTHCFNSMREAQTSPNTGVREVLSKETIMKWQSLLIISRHSLAPRPSPQALARGNKASLFPSLVTEGDGKLESWEGPENKASLNLSSSPSLVTESWKAG